MEIIKGSEEMLKELEILKTKYYKSHGIKPNVVIFGRENFTALLKNKKEFKAVTLTEENDKIGDLTILQVHNLKMFKVGNID